MNHVYACALAGSALSATGRLRADDHARGA